MACSILSIVPYTVLPPITGGRQGIAVMHHYIGMVCEDHIVSTETNSPNHNYSFRLHPIMSGSKFRYLPFYKYAAMAALVKKYNISSIYCDHPYMAFTATLLSKRLKIPWYMRSHNIESERFRSLKKKWWPLMYLLERFAMKSASGIFFVTQEDKETAISRYHLPEAKCHIAPFGTPLEKAPQGHHEAKIKLAADLKLNPELPFLYFLGVLDYYPNTQAVTFIIDEVLPRLQKKGIACQVIIAGKGLPQNIQQQIANTPNILYAGFVPVLETFLTGSDIMLNPVQAGGGIKTKVVEALAYNKIVVSTTTGAAGLQPQACGNNLMIAADNDWDAFTENIITAINTRPQIPQSFYDMYYWGNIAKKVKEIMVND